MSKNNNQFYKKNWIQRGISFVIVILIIIVGLHFSKFLMKTKKKPKRKKHGKITINVETMTPKKVDINYKINGFGRIYPVKSVTLIPEVQGRIIYVNKKFNEGGFFKKGEIILKIDDRDYKINLKIEEAKLKSLLEDLKIEEAKSISAIKELKTAHKLIKDIDNKSIYIIERKPYIKKIKEEINATKEKIKKAKLDLSRTIIKAPFNCVITKKYVDLGGYVSPGLKIAEIVLSGYYYVRGNIVLSDLKYLKNKNAAAYVYFQNGISMKAHLKYIEKELDKKGMMVKVILSLIPKNDNNVFLYDYVTFDIFGKMLNNIYRIDRQGLRENDTVWLVKDGYLKIKRINVIFKNLKYAYTYDLTERDKIIITNLSSVTDGIKVKEVKR